VSVTKPIPRIKYRNSKLAKILNGLSSPAIKCNLGITGDRNDVISSFYLYVCFTITLKHLDLCYGTTLFQIDITSRDNMFVSRMETGIVGSVLLIRNVGRD
jgi:hypothetical protein